MHSFLISFGAIFVAELGDKSQLMAMTFAARYRFWTVLAGITVATAAVHLLSVAAGSLLGAGLPTRAVNILAGLAFIGFGIWTLRGEELSAGDRHRAARTRRYPLLAIAGAFALAELGDKTMLATVTLATSEEWFGTWLGSTMGMVAADALAIGLGTFLGRALPAEFVRIAASILFFAFGAWLIAGEVVS